jgi:hypothetical protein
MLTRWYVSASFAARRMAEGIVRSAKEERGALSLEWIGIGILAMAVIGVTVSWLGSKGQSGDSTVGQALLEKLRDIIAAIGKGGKPDSN